MEHLLLKVRMEHLLLKARMEYLLLKARMEHQVVATPLAPLLPILSTWPRTSPPHTRDMA
jgi:hypothetical protein